MTTIGGLTLRSYALPYRLGANASQSAQPTGTPLASSAGAGLVSGDTASIKLSAALWALSNPEDSSAQGEDVWAGWDTGGTVAEQEFGDLADMDLADMIRAKYLKDRKLTEEKLAALPAEEREAIEAEIREAILRALDPENDAKGTAGAEQVSAAPLG